MELLEELKKLANDEFMKRPDEIEEIKEWKKKLESWNLNKDEVNFYLKEMAKKGFFKTSNFSIKDFLNDIK